MSEEFGVKEQSFKATAFLIIVTGVLALDQLTKLFFPSLGFRIIQNKEFIFGLISFPLELYLVLSFLAIGILGIVFLKIKECGKSPVFLVSLALIIGGLLGNLVDRLLLGFVRDFIDLKIWPVFNLADLAISLGGITFFFNLIKQKRLRR